MAHDAGSDNRYTRTLAHFIAGLRYERIPTEVLERIKLLMLDSLGCAVYAAHLPWSRILIETLKRVDTSAGATVWGTAEKLSAPHAALANGSLVQGFELDDVHRVGVLHVGAVTLPALIAISETLRRMSGKEFLSAAVAGYETGPRVGMCMGQEHVGQGWHSGATVGVFSAAAGAARGLALNTEQTVHALGIAGTQSCGLMAAQYGAMVKRMHAGRASQSGLYGGMLAAGGFTGIMNVFESEYGGFCTTFSRSTDRFDMEKLVTGLGEQWETLRVALKFYSCVGSNHTTLDALQDMQREQPYGPQDVERIVVHGSQVTMDHVGWKYQPQGLTSAQLNLPFCVATLLLEGDVFVDQFPESCVNDPARMTLAEKVEVRHDPEITARGSASRHMVRVELHLKSGKRMERRVEAPRGSEHTFATQADVVEKFRKLAGHVFPTPQVEELRDAMLHLDELDDVNRIVELLATR